jgi:hypothetical protein
LDATEPGGESQASSAVFIGRLETQEWTQIAADLSPSLGSMVVGDDTLVVDRKGVADVWTPSGGWQDLTLPADAASESVRTHGDLQPTAAGLVFWSVVAGGGVDVVAAKSGERIATAAIGDVDSLFPVLNQPGEAIVMTTQGNFHRIRIDSLTGAK